MASFRIYCDLKKMFDYPHWLQKHRLKAHTHTHSYICMPVYPHKHLCTGGVARKCFFLSSYLMSWVLLKKTITSEARVKCLIKISIGKANARIIHQSLHSRLLVQEPCKHQSPHPWQLVLESWKHQSPHPWLCCWASPPVACWAAQEWQTQQQLPQRLPLKGHHSPVVSQLAEWPPCCLAERPLCHWRAVLDCHFCGPPSLPLPPPLSHAPLLLSPAKAHIFLNDSHLAANTLATVKIYSYCNMYFHLLFIHCKYNHCEAAAY